MIIYAFALYLQTNIIIECLCFQPPKIREKWIQFDSHIHIVFKKRVAK